MNAATKKDLATLEATRLKKIGMTHGVVRFSGLTDGGFPVDIDIITEGEAAGTCSAWVYTDKKKKTVHFKTEDVNVDVLFFMLEGEGLACSPAGDWMNGEWVPASDL